MRRDQRRGVVARSRAIFREKESKRAREQEQEGKRARGQESKRARGQESKSKRARGQERRTDLVLWESAVDELRDGKVDGAVAKKVVAREVRRVVVDPDVV